MFAYSTNFCYMHKFVHIAKNCAIGKKLRNLRNLRNLKGFQNTSSPNHCPDTPLPILIINRSAVNQALSNRDLGNLLNLLNFLNFLNCCL